MHPIKYTAIIIIVIIIIIIILIIIIITLSRYVARLN